MRREFIMMLLGIISISSLSSYLSSYIQIEADNVLLDTVIGTVGAGNFSYWQLGHTGPILVELLSITGDADLYVSDNVRPSFETDRNNFSSITCGPDIIEVPSDFPRPVGIAVFGHWSHHVSEYSIQVYQDLAEYVRAAGDSSQMNGGADDAGTDPSSTPERSKVAPQKTEGHATPKYLSLLALLDMFFDIFAI